MRLAAASHCVKSRGAFSSIMLHVTIVYHEDSFRSALFTELKLLLLPFSIFCLKTSPMFNVCMFVTCSSDTLGNEDTASLPGTGGRG